MLDEQEQPGHADQQRVRVEQLPERPDVVALRIHRHAADDVAERDADEQRGYQAAEEEGAVPHGAPAAVTVAELERDRPQDEPEQHEHDRQVEAAEGHGVHHGEGGEDGAGAGEEPDLVAVPHGADRRADDALLVVALRDEGIEHARAEVEAVEDHVHREQDRDEEEPDVGQGHLVTSLHRRERARCPSPPRASPRCLRGPS